MNHSFNVEIAARYGVNAAILFERIAFWCQSNAANGRNMHEGRAWTFDSIRALCEIFPYFTVSAIRTALDKLENEGMILSGTFNEDRRDRTKWYALSDDGLAAFEGKMQLQKKETPFAENRKALPIIDTVIDMDKQQQQDARAREDEPVETETVNPDLQRVVKSYQTQIGEIPNGRAWELLKSYVDDLGADAVIVAIEETNLQQPAQPWSWLKKILDGFADKGVHSAEAAKAAVADHRRTAAARTIAPRAAPEKTGQDRFNYQHHTYTEADFGADFYDNALAILGFQKEDST